MTTAPRVLQAWELALALVAGAAGFVLCGFLLGPWPDLVGEEARGMGQIRWYGEYFKSFAPPVAGVAVSAGMIAALKRRRVGQCG